MEKKKLKSSAFLVQCLSSLCISFLATQTGFVTAWPSYTIANFTSNITVLGRPMTSMEVSLLGSLPNLGGLVATPFCGYAFNKLGRKYATILFGLPYMISWLTISLTKSVTVVLIAATVAGIGIAGQNVSLIFISEISHTSIRGGMTAASASGYFVGILLSYVFGGYLSYYGVLYTHLTLAVFTVGMLLLLRESPTYLVMVGREKEAAESIAFYNRVDATSEFVQMEIRNIRIQLDPKLETLLEENLDKEAADQLLKTKLGEVIDTRKESTWRIFLKSKSSKRALGTVFVVIASSIMMGSVVLQVYAEPLFREAVPSVSPNLCAIVLAVDFLVASILCVLVIDRFGRKRLMLVTSALSGVCTLLLGAQLQFHWASHWVTALLIYVYSFVYTVGCAVIPFVLAAEVFLPEVRGLCNSACMGFVWIVNFITLFIFNPLVDLLGLGPVFYCFSTICFLAALYTQLRVPETMGLTTDEIQAMFLKKR